MIKKNCLFLLSFLAATSGVLNAQSYQGFLSDNYSGVHRVLLNPAEIADSPFRTDINIIGASSLLGNDYYAVKLGDAITKDYNFNEAAQKSPSDSNTIFGMIDILGPSFTVNLGKKSTMALFTRGRAYFNVNDINGKTFENATSEFDENVDYDIDEGDFFAHANLWSELGLSYATILLNKGAHFIKGGFSLKYLQGYANAYLQGRNVSIVYDADGTLLPNGESIGSIGASGQITYAYTGSFRENQLQRAGTGVGLDFGAVYEYRPVNATSYKFKLGLSIMDLGTIDYGNEIENSYEINNTITQGDLDSADGLQEILNTFYTKIGSGDAQKAALPKAVHVNIDYSFNDKWFVDIHALGSMTKGVGANTADVVDMITVTPRFQSKGFAFYVPISMVENIGLQGGAGFRAGPLYIGSGALLTALFGNEVQSVDMYAGLKLSLFKGDD